MYITACTRALILWRVWGVEKIPMVACFRVRESKAAAMAKAVRPARAAYKVGELTGKRAAVVGASRGLGLEFARQLALKGNRVLAGARDPEASSGLQKLKQQSGELETVQVDVTSDDSVKAFAQEAKSRLDHVDLLLNIAGTISTRGYDRWDIIVDGRAECLPEDVRYAMETNALGPYKVVQELLVSGAIGGTEGTLVGNMSSKVGSAADNFSGGGYAYRASKAALNLMSVSMSVDLADMGVTTVLLHPGFVRTDMTEGEGFIEPTESVEGLLTVLEGKCSSIGHDLNGKWIDYKCEVVPW